MKELPSSNRILPPDVKGSKSRGSFELVFEEIHWKSKSYPAVELKVLFWGQQAPTNLKYFFAFD